MKKIPFKFDLKYKAVRQIEPDDSTLITDIVGFEFYLDKKKKSFKLATPAKELY